MALLECRWCNGTTEDNPKIRCSNCGQYQDPAKIIDDLKLDVDFLKNEVLALKAQLENIPVAERVF